MSHAKKTVRRLRCPVCLLNSKDPHLQYDPKTETHYCQSCCFTGTEAEIESYYEVFRRKYKQLNAPLQLKKI